MLPRQTEQLPCVRVVPVLEGRCQNRILIIRGARVCIRGVGRGVEHLIIPRLFEEGLSDMNEATGVGNNRAGSEDQSRFSIIEGALDTNPLVDLVQFVRTIR